MIVGVDVGSQLARLVSERSGSQPNRFLGVGLVDQADNLRPYTGRFAQESATWRGRLHEIVRELESTPEGILEEESRRMIERAVAQAEAQAKLYIDMERRRWERGHHKEDAEEKPEAP